MRLQLALQPLLAVCLIRGIGFGDRGDGLAIGIPLLLRELDALGGLKALPLACTPASRQDANVCKWRVFAAPGTIPSKS